MTEVQIKSAVRTRDGMRCTKCGMTNAQHRAKHGRKGLEVHRCSPGSAYSVGGCVTLCKSCHGREPKSPAKRRVDSDKIPGLADNLRSARAAAGLSQVQAGEKAGVHHVSIAKFETEKATPTLRVLYLLAAAYGVEVADLLPPAPKKKGK